MIPEELLDQRSNLEFDSNNLQVNEKCNIIEFCKSGLTFDCNFEAGNLGNVRRVSDFEYEINLRPDTNAPRYRLWFYFRVKLNKKGPSTVHCNSNEHRVVFTITNFSKNRSLYKDGMAPLVRSTSRPQWERIPRKNVFYIRSNKYKAAAFIMSFIFTFDKSEDEYFFAYSYPFTYTHQQKLLAELEAQSLPFVRRELLCRSVQGRRVDIISLGDIHPLSKSFSPNGKKRRVIIVVGRVHPGETPSSFVVQGLINFLSSSSDRDAERIRREMTFIIVPMLNPDGCFLGNYRTCSLGIDHNRRWQYPTQAMEPSLQAVKQLFSELYCNPGVLIDFFIDVHAHSTARYGFFLCNPPARNGSRSTSTSTYINSRNGNTGNGSKNVSANSHNQNGQADTSNPQAINSLERSSHLTDISAFPRLLANNVKEFSLPGCKLCTDPCKAGCARRVLGSDFPDVVCYTLEISFYAAPFGTGSALTSQLYRSTSQSQKESVSNSMSSNQSNSVMSTNPCPNTEKGYVEFGKQLAYSFMNYYKIPKIRQTRASSAVWQNLVS